METQIFEPVRDSVEVGLAPEQAFELFTAHLGTWWPHNHQIGARPFVEGFIEPTVGGRWYERRDPLPPPQGGHNRRTRTPPLRKARGPQRADARFCFRPERVARGATRVPPLH